MKPFAVLCLLAAGLVTVSGCAVGPDFHPPQTAVPQGWEGVKMDERDQTSVTTAQPLDLVDWWSRFDDPVLTSLVERAIASNLDLARAKSRIRQARAARGVVAAGFWPLVNTTAAYQRSGTGAPSSGGGGTGGSGASGGGGGADLDLFQAGLDAAWELDIFGGVRRDVEASTADIQDAIEDRRDVLVSLIAEVGTNYINLRGLQEQIFIARKNLQAQQHNAEITRKRFEAGFVGALDVANARAQAATTESQIPVLESSAQAAIYSLGVLLGREPAALAGELSEEAAIPTTPPQVPVGLPSDLLRRRPDIRRAEAQLHGATARIGVATADLFPKFSLTGSLGFSGGDLASLAKWSSSAWSFGPSVTWPIFDAGRIRSNIEVQNALEEQALLQYRQTVLIALQDVETALVAYAKEQQHWKALMEAVEQNRKAVDLAMKLYVAGRTDFLNVLSAQNALYASETALSQSAGSMATNLVAIYKALGGGWERES
jgi:NodT family efflux transporter outer membrane factor (OMF) lipoprotein